MTNLYKLIFFRPWEEILARGMEMIFGWPLYGLSFLMPRNKHRWVVGTTTTAFVDNPKYLYYTLLAQGEDVAFISATRKRARALRKEGIRAYFKYSLKGFHYSMTARYYGCNYRSKDVNFFTSGGAKIINMWHGVGIKSLTKAGKDTINNAMPLWVAHYMLPHLFETPDLFLSTSPLMTKHFSGMFPLTEKNTYEGMYPRCDFMRQDKSFILKHIEQHETPEMLSLVKDLEQYNKVYIYMPTWRANLKDQFLEVAGFDFSQLEQTLAKTNSMFLFKLHPAVRVHGDYADYKHIRFMDKDMDMYPILPFTDILITDYSSIYYDYLLMDGKGAILFPFDQKDYEANSDPLAFDYDTYTPGKRVYNFAELLQLIAANDDCQVPERQWVMEQFWGKDYAQKNTAQLIERVLNLR